MSNLRRIAEALEGIQPRPGCGFAMQASLDALAERVRRLQSQSVDLRYEPGETCECTAFVPTEVHS